MAVVEFPEIEASIEFIDPPAYKGRPPGPSSETMQRLDQFIDNPDTWGLWPSKANVQNLRRTAEQYAPDHKWTFRTSGISSERKTYVRCSRIASPTTTSETTTEPPTSTPKVPFGSL